MARKYIINNNEIIMGNVEFHIELIGKNMKKSDTIGGGRWFFDPENKKCYFYGSSSDFGSVTKEQFMEAWSNSLISPFIEECEIFWSERIDFSDAVRRGWEKLDLQNEN